MYPLLYCPFMTQCLQQVVVLVIFNILSDNKILATLCRSQNHFWKFWQRIKSKCLGAAELKEQIRDLSLDESAMCGDSGNRRGGR